MKKRQKVKESDVLVDNEFYSPRELIKNKEFRSQIGVMRFGEMTEGSAYSYVLTAIRLKVLKSYKTGLGEVTYYKVKGKDAKEFIKNRLKLN